MDLDRTNRETLRQGPPLELPVTASSILSGDWRDDITDREIEEEFQEQRHEAKRRGEG